MLQTPAAPIFQTTAFKLAAICAATFGGCTLLLFGFIYWQTSIYQSDQIKQFLLTEVETIANSDPTRTVTTLDRQSPQHSTTGALIALLKPDGSWEAGNFARLPAGLPVDGRVHQVSVFEVDPDVGSRHVYAVAKPLADGRTLVVARDVQVLGELRRAVIRALELGLLPALACSLIAAVLLSWRAVQHVKSLRVSINRIMAGNLHERLPIGRGRDDFDRLAESVNRMLDQIEHLLSELKSVGDDIAHDLRTPLTRVRMRLERGRAATERDGSPELLEDTLTGAIAGLDQALLVITALLRIYELEDSRRRAGFGDINLTDVLADVAELYGPIAEEKQVHLVESFQTDEPQPIRGDRALLVEAVANIVDNAIKFTPSERSVSVDLLTEDGFPIIRVSDEGPGIPEEEQEAVLKRFYRSDRSRHFPGSGLGLGLVAAIVRLHKFSIRISDSVDGGCCFDIICQSSVETAPKLAVCDISD